MSIQKKLILSLGAMIVVPMILFSVVLFILFSIFSGDEGIMNTETSIERIDKREDLFAELKLMTTDNPSNLFDSSYLSSIDKQLNEWGYGLIVRVEDDIVYTSSYFRDVPLLQHLPRFGEFVNHTHENIEIDELALKFRQHDFYFPNREQGSIFLVEEANSFEQLLQDHWLLIFVILIIILILTNGLISYFLSKSFLNPIRLLQKSTKQIKEGDLTFQLLSNRKDEIGELITDFEEMRNKLKDSIELQLQYEHNRKLLLSNISHDLKTPITSIKGYVEGIKDGVANTEEKKDKYMARIFKRVNEMDAMIDELSLYSTLDFKEAPFYFQKLDLTRYLQECIEELKPDFEKKGVELDLERRTNFPVVIHADREKFTRVINNILQNSLKYMDKNHGKIHLSLNKNGDNAVLEVIDNGQGIHEEALPHIFETFYRADASRNKKTGGTGLGLAIAKQIIEGHNGSIIAESIVHQGTKVTITIPLFNKKEADENDENINN